MCINSTVGITLQSCPDPTHSLVNIHDLLNGLLFVEQPPQSPVEELAGAPPLKDVLCLAGRDDHIQ